MVYDPLSVAFEIREQLVSEKRRIAFFFGAGTSMAVGIPGIKELTTQVSERIKSPFKESLDMIKSELPKDADIESILNRIRIYRELIGESEEIEYCGIKGAKTVKALDSEICHAICDIIGAEPPMSLEPHYKFAQWLRSLCFNRNYPVELFTTNYDLFFEQAMEKFGIPFFDGFIGSVNPFFLPESVDSEFDGINEISCPPRSWTRLWKIHGSINWYKQSEAEQNEGIITRLSTLKPKRKEERFIHPQLSR
ncbi:MAG: SIR2 family protein [Methanothrix sp.]|nr:SIR2 family protein [Methanothrix sp.]